MSSNIHPEHLDDMNTVENHKFVLIISTTDQTTSTIITSRLRNAIQNLGTTAQVTLTVDHHAQVTFDNQDW
jgi:3-methyladenine DNA glycosylase AlkC